MKAYKVSGSIYTPDCSVPIDIDKYFLLRSTAFEYRDSMIKDRTRAWALKDFHLNDNPSMPVCFERILFTDGTSMDVIQIDIE